MRKRVIQALVGLIIVSGLVLGPIAPGAVARRAGRVLAPGRVLAQPMRGWDSGGSTGG
jgi:hypothetical protein